MKIVSLKSIFIALLFPMLCLLGCSHVNLSSRHPSHIKGVSKGMPFDEVISALHTEDSRLEAIELAEYIKVLGVKHRVLANYFHYNTVSDAFGNTIIIHDAFYIIFDENDNLLTMGYPYEFIRSENPFHQALWKELMLKAG